MKIIKESIPVTELLAGLAEECSELAQAALKLRRVIDPKQLNPTPKKQSEATEDFYEEIADVFLYLKHIDLPLSYIRKIEDRKQKRWEDRLNGQYKDTSM